VAEMWFLPIWQEQARYNLGEEQRSRDLQPNRWPTATIWIGFGSAWLVRRTYWDNGVVRSDLREYLSIRQFSEHVGVRGIHERVIVSTD
jgi:hypothetical protein